MELLTARPHVPARPAPLARGWLALVLFLAAWTSAGAAAAPATQVPEYNAKAGYLLLFTRYVVWPESAFSSPEAPIVIGILGENPFGDVLERTVNGLRSQGRPIIVREVDTPLAARECHVVFIARHHQTQEAAWLELLAAHPVLTVTESGHGLERGAVLDLALEETLRGTRVTFSASLSAARDSGLQLSASMLASARRVDRQKPAPEPRS